MRALTFAALLVAGAAGLAHADLVPERVVVVGRAGPDAPWTDAPTEAHVDDGAELAVVVIARDRGRALAIADDDVAPLVIGGHAIKPRARRPWSALGPGAQVRWSTVE